MSRVLFTSVGAALLAAALAMPAQAQQAQRPQIETKKVDGTDNVYLFRNGNHQAIFIVTKEGVIATDPVAHGQPNGGQQYVDEIKKVTNQPIKYLIYSHHHYDHIAGGKAFKDAGADHPRAQERQGAARAACRSQHAAARSIDQRPWPNPQARRHHAGAEVCRQEPFRLDAGDVPAEGQDHLSWSTCCRSGGCRALA